MDFDDLIHKIFPEAKDIPGSFWIGKPIEQREYLISGEIRFWEGPMCDVHSPVCVHTDSGLSQLHLGRVPNMTENESTSALEAALKAWDKGRGLWPTLPPAERIGCVEGFLRECLKRKKEVARLLMWEIGKPYKDSAIEFDRAIEYIKDTLEVVKDLDRISSKWVGQKGIMGLIKRAPLGVVLCTGPFNYPFYETFTTLMTALVMGNTVIFKPPKYGVLLYRPLLKVLCDAFPEGVVNSIYGDGETIIPPLMSSGKVDVLAFIGTTAVASALKKQHPNPHRLRCLLGLEAKNPAIILPDADLDLAIRECVLGTLAFNGQRCAALKILFVHSRIVKAFLEGLSNAIARLRFGMPWEADVFITPLPEPHKPAYLNALVNDALAHGASVINEGGGRVYETFFYPTILFPVNDEMRVYHEEQFGPVIPVVPFDNVEIPIQYVIQTRYGQQLSIFGTDPETMADLIDPLVNQVARVNINCKCQRGPDTFPFTGRKDSAEGTLSVSDALRAFSIRTVVAARDTDVNRGLMQDIMKKEKSNFLKSNFFD
ncbi:MAG: NADP-dependent glyceraldehyde-3-phosphate dehydrogenase [Deltaproteobacteria bacterium]|nr:NADP-dependent glyceraldehyde-3-phosphate dehydrogenase [Deltaproteobacteria bacterium]